YEGSTMSAKCYRSGASTDLLWSVHLNRSADLDACAQVADALAEGLSDSGVHAYFRSSLRSFSDTVRKFTKSRPQTLTAPSAPSSTPTASPVPHHPTRPEQHLRHHAIPAAADASRNRPLPGLFPRAVPEGARGRDHQL